MKIGVVSGKGGTGKTLVAVNLAYTASKNRKVTLYDLDVEEPNSFLFFKEYTLDAESVKQMIPKVDDTKCNSCGICSKVCEFNAIINIGEKIIVFPELCHSCYACLELCPKNAITENFKEIGKIQSSKNSQIALIEGRLNITETSCPSLIREVKKRNNIDSSFCIYDSPPGTSCSVVEAIKDLDYIVVVAEPTIFGFHDFKLMVETIKTLNKDFGVVINKHNQGNSTLEKYCLENSIEIIEKIPLCYEIASAYAHGNLICENNHELQNIFQNIQDYILEKESGILT